jgi:YD repeat-containing protein
VHLLHFIFEVTSTCPMKLFHLIVSSFLVTSAIGQHQNNLDSLKSVLTNSNTEDTSLVILLNRISQVASETEPKEALQYAERAITVATKLKYSKGIADAFRQKSQYYWNQADNLSSMNFAFEALKSYEAIANSRGMSSSNIIIGLNHVQLNEPGKSAEIFQSSL